jgi:hypothetical protein
MFDLEINDPYSFLKFFKVLMISKFDKVTISMAEIHFDGLKMEKCRQSMVVFSHLEVGGNQRSRSV